MRLEEFLTKEQLKISRHNRLKTRKVLNVPKGYDLHHRDESLRHTDIERYILWLPEDLEIISHAEHARLHKPAKGKHWTLSEETRKNQSKAQKGKKHSEETKSKISESRKGIIFTEEHKKHLSEARKGVPLSETHKQALRGRRWYTNGIKSIMLRPDDIIPDGFYPGMAKRSNRCDIL